MNPDSAPQQPEAALPSSLAADAVLYERCVRFVVENRKASTALLQRQFGLAYGKAALFLDRMEEEGIVGPHEGACKPRKVLVEKHGHNTN